MNKLEITVQLDRDEILIAIKRPEGYETVIPELLAEDAIHKEFFEYRILYPGIESIADE